MTPLTAQTKRLASLRKSFAWGCIAVGFAVVSTAPVTAQGWNWPWDTPQQKPAPREPVYRPQQPNNPSQWTPPPGPPAPGQNVAPQPPQQGAQSYSAKSNICIQLEQRLVQEGQRGNQSRDLMPMVESEMGQVEQQARAAQQQLDRSDCYEFFLFTKNLRSTRKCKDLSSAVEQSRRRLADLDVQRQQLQSSSGRSYADDIVRELAHNNCPGNYASQASRRDGGGSIWQEDSGNGGGGLGNYNSVPYATYRTLCVRQCDGYYFPISFSTLPNHFERDAELCQSKCAAPVDLYYYQNPGGAVDQMLGYRSNEPYKSMKTAFRYRKEFVAGCSCKQTEFVPDPNATVQSGSAAPPPATTGTTAREAATAPQTSGWSTDTAPQ